MRRISYKKQPFGTRDLYILVVYYTTVFMTHLVGKLFICVSIWNGSRLNIDIKRPRLHVQMLVNYLHN